MPLPILSVAEVRDWENRTWGAGVAVESVMDRAGQAIARLAMRLTQSGDRILLLAGKGNNGGDTRIAAEYLSDRNSAVVGIEDPGDSLGQLKESLGANPALIVDGLFGIGLNRDLSIEWQKIIAQINSAGVPVLSIDCPSGLDADTGHHRGAAVKAAVTLALGSVKAGLLAASATEHIGRLRVASDIGLVNPAPEAGSYWVAEGDMRGVRSKRCENSHKGDHGYVAIIAGSTGYHGAALLAARASLRAQPGLVSVYTPAYQPVAAQCQSVMVHPWGKESIEPLSRATALVAGPGLAAPHIEETLRNTVRNLWEHSNNPMLIDASALRWIRECKPNTEAFRLLTPHPGEAAMLLDCSVSEIESDRLSAARNIADRYRSTVILKGRHTVMAQSTGPALVNSTGNAGLAQGGSGDVLAGYIGGLLAQPEFKGREIQAAMYAVWKHGWAADQLSVDEGYWGMDDLIEQLGKHEFSLKNRHFYA